MKVENIAVVLKPRTPYEAIDLGFSMARQWFWPLVAIWAVLAVPVFLLAHVLMPQANLTLAGLIFWWLKPVYEKPMTYYLSRKLFHDAPPLKTMLKQTLSINKQNLLPTILWQRLTFSRSFNMPVSLLEGLSGAERSARIRTLEQNIRSASQWLTIVCLHLEAFLYLALFILIIFLTPENLVDEDIKYLIFEQPMWVIYLLEGCFLLAAGIIAPFYVAAGFALYLSRRSELEGWDIELEFKKLADGAVQKLINRAPTPDAEKSNMQHASLGEPRQAS